MVRRSQGTRILGFEPLDARLCLAFGDIDLGFAEDGFFETSYQQADNQARIRGFFERSDDYAKLISVQTGSGSGFVLASIDESGMLTQGFGGDGLAHIKDGVNDTYGASFYNAIQLTDGSYVTVVASDPEFRLVSILPDGSLNVDFGEAGTVPTVRNARLFASPNGGFLLGESAHSSGDTSLWKYHSNGSIDRSFGFEGEQLFPTLQSWDLRFELSGSMIVFGRGYDQATDSSSFSQIRFLADGTRDLGFGINGTLASESFNRHSPVVHSSQSGYSSLSVIESVDGRVVFEIKSTTEQGEAREIFGAQGTATFHISGFQSRLSVFGFEALSDGSFLVGFIERLSGSASRIILAKVTPYGELDSEFGTDGVMANLIADALQAYGVFESSRGDLFLYGDNFDDPWMMKVGRDGTLDSSFGNTGVLIREYTPESVGVGRLEVHAVAKQGWLLSSGWAGSLGAWQMRRFGAGGEFAGSFDLLSGSPGERVAAASDGGWYVIKPNLGQAQQRVILISKYSSTGKLDVHFGNEGRVFVDSPKVSVISVREQRDGDVLIFAGATRFVTPDLVQQLGASLAIRINSLGLDTGFGEAGVVRLPRKDFIGGLALPDGAKLLLYEEPSSAGDLILLRLKHDGTVDLDFGSQGVMRSPVRYQSLYDVTVDEFGRLLLIVTRLGVLKLVRLNASGTLDLSFTGDGSFEVPLSTPYRKPIHVRARQGVILVAGTDLVDRDSRVRLVALDYEGTPLPQLDGDGIKDFSIADSVESVSDIEFDSSGGLILAVTYPDAADRYGRVYRLEGTGIVSRHNWFQPFDVNDDHVISSLDVLLIIDHLNGNPLQPGVFPDTSLDTQVSPIDALLVIGYLNNLASQGEGEPIDSREQFNPDYAFVEEENWEFFEPWR